MKKMKFEEIWSEFNWVLDEMKEGMCFFEGYIPSIAISNFQLSLCQIMDRSRNHSFKNSVWANDTFESDWNKEYSLSQYVDLFSDGRILSMHFDYEITRSGVDLILKIIFDKEDNKISMEIICYREPILKNEDSEEAVCAAIEEFRDLQNLFGGDALFIGPDTSNVHRSTTDYPREWLRID